MKRLRAAKVQGLEPVEVRPLRLRADSFHPLCGRSRLQWFLKTSAAPQTTAGGIGTALGRIGFPTSHKLAIHQREVGARNLHHLALCAHHSVATAAHLLRHVCCHIREHEHPRQQQTDDAAKADDHLPHPAAFLLDLLVGVSGLCELMKSHRSVAVDIPLLHHVLNAGAQMAVAHICRVLALLAQEIRHQYQRFVHLFLCHVTLLTAKFLAHHFQHLDHVIHIRVIHHSVSVHVDVAEQPFDIARKVHRLDVCHGAIRQL
mmetsp:Transcript_59349/g.82372  ORF Transcript_59349/g.82372 Transcript_59349/m.82372 type:complete len:260 (+) Transcript_59349:657-1436(+)